MRLIDADALMTDEMTHTLPKGCGRSSGRIVVFADDIEKAPTADVVEVRHGEWKVCGMFDDFITCSVCKSNKYPFGYGFKYCPECGAKMDGERRGQ